MRTLHRYDIDGISLLAYDEADSQSANWVAWELQADDYRLRDMRFGEGDVVIDIGAHIGLFSIYLAKRWPVIKVFSFEPFPVNFRNCAENLQLNGITNIVLSPKAITNDNRLLNMATDPHNSGGASAIVKTYESNGMNLEANLLDLLDRIKSGLVTDLASMTLDEVFLVHEIGRCKLMKIDCEGMEYEILLGTRVLDKVEYLAGEFHASRSLQSRGWCPERLHAYCSSFFADNKMKIQFNQMPE